MRCIRFSSENGCDMGAAGKPRRARILPTGGAARELYRPLELAGDGEHGWAPRRRTRATPAAGVAGEHRRGNHAWGARASLLSSGRGAANALGGERVRICGSQFVGKCFFNANIL
jgi:hypothetical protein